MSFGEYLFLKVFGAAIASTSMVSASGLWNQSKNDYDDEVLSACNNIGSGAIAGGVFSLMVGTSGAMRAVAPAGSMEIPGGLWCYRVDRGRSVLGGSLSNGGEVYAWMRRVLALPDDTVVVPGHGPKTTIGEERDSNPFLVKS